MNVKDYPIYRKRMNEFKQKKLFCLLLKRTKSNKKCNVFNSDFMNNLSKNRCKIAFFQVNFMVTFCFTEQLKYQFSKVHVNSQL